jgi:hypothetical protein
VGKGAKDTSAKLQRTIEDQEKDIEQLQQALLDRDAKIAMLETQLANIAKVAATATSAEPAKKTAAPEPKNWAEVVAHKPAIEAGPRRMPAWTPVKRRTPKPRPADDDDIISVDSNASNDACGPKGVIRMDAKKQPRRERVPAHQSRKRAIVEVNAVGAVSRDRNNNPLVVVDRVEVDGVTYRTIPTRGNATLSLRSRETRDELHLRGVASPREGFKAYAHIVDLTTGQLDPSVTFVCKNDLRKLFAAAHQVEDDEHPTRSQRRTRSASVRTSQPARSKVDRKRGWGGRF